MNNPEGASFIHRFFGHLHTIDKHRFIVMRLCFKMGLYRQGLAHDLSKYSPSEFWPGVRYFQGDKSPIVAERRALGYSYGWLHHKGRNPHHWEFWTDRIGTRDDARLIVREMPKRYVKEMTCDRIAACMVYQGSRYRPDSALNFHLQSAERKFLPAATDSMLTRYLTIVADNDLDTAIRIIRQD